MYRLLAPGPSSLVEGRPASCGKNPSMSLKATCSMRYRPSVPLEFASPCGNSRVRELKRIRMDSTMDAPRTTVFPYASYSSLLVVSTKETPRALPVEPSTKTLRTAAFVRSVKFFIFSSLGNSTSKVLNREAVSHPKLHAPQ